MLPWPSRQAGAFKRCSLRWSHFHVRARGRGSSDGRAGADTKQVAALEGGHHTTTMPKTTRTPETSTQPGLSAAFGKGFSLDRRGRENGGDPPSPALSCNVTAACVVCAGQAAPAPGGTGSAEDALSSQTARPAPRPAPFPVSQRGGTRTQPAAKDVFQPFAQAAEKGGAGQEPAELTETKEMAPGTAPCASQLQAPHTSLPHLSSTPLRLVPISLPLQGGVCHVWQLLPVTGSSRGGSAACHAEQHVLPWPWPFRFLPAALEEGRPNLPDPFLPLQHLPKYKKWCAE